MGEDDVRQQLTALRVSVDALTESVDEVQGEIRVVQAAQKQSADSHHRLHAETKGLHEEHLALVDKLRVQERIVEVHLRDYERAQERNDLIHAHMTGATMALQEEVREFRGEFREDRATSAKAQEQDRKEAYLSAKQTNDALRKTIITIVVSGGGLFLTLVGLLITLWTYADNLSRALGALKAGAGL